MQIKKAKNCCAEFVAPAAGRRIGFDYRSFIRRRGRRRYKSLWFCIQSTIIQFQYEILAKQNKNLTHSYAE